MLTSRNERRLAQKQINRAAKAGSAGQIPVPIAIDQIQMLAQRIPELMVLVKDLKGLEGLPQNLDQLRHAISIVLEDFQGIEHEQRKQRIVNLRLQAGNYTRPIDALEWCDLELQFRTEFDALISLIALVNFAKNRT